MTARKPSDIIRKGQTFTGRKLVEAIQAGGLPFGGRRIMVKGSGSQATVSVSGHQIIPKISTFWVILNAFNVLAGQTNQWEYTWTQAKLDPATGRYVPETTPPVITWQTTGESKARNTFEQANTGTVVRAGEPVTIGSSTIEIGPVGFNAQGQSLGFPVLTWIAGNLLNGNRLRVFTEVNPTKGVVCTP